MLAIFGIALPKWWSFDTGRGTPLALSAVSYFYDLCCKSGHPCNVAFKTTKHTVLLLGGYRHHYFVEKSLRISIPIILLALAVI